MKADDDDDATAGVERVGGVARGGVADGPGTGGGFLVCCLLGGCRGRKSESASVSSGRAIRVADARALDLLPEANIESSAAFPCPTGDLEFVAASIVATTFVQQ